MQPINNSLLRTGTTYIPEHFPELTERIQAIAENLDDFLGEEGLSDLYDIEITPSSISGKKFQIQVVGCSQQDDSIFELPSTPVKHVSKIDQIHGAAVQLLRSLMR